jgi:hypothetical protein
VVSTWRGVSASGSQCSPTQPSRGREVCCARPKEQCVHPINALGCNRPGAQRVGGSTATARHLRRNGAMSSEMGTTVAPPATAASVHASHAATPSSSTRCEACTRLGPWPPHNSSWPRRSMCHGQPKVRRLPQQPARDGGFPTATETLPRTGGEPQASHFDSPLTHTPPPFQMLPHPSHHPPRVQVLIVICELCGGKLQGALTLQNRAPRRSGPGARIHFGARHIEHSESES